MTSARRALRDRLTSGDVVLAPLCLEPLVARLCEELGYEAGYVSGGGLGYSLAVSEALLTMDEISSTTRAISRRSSLPLIVDGGVGFGDPVQVARMMWDLEAAGAAAVEIEDQVAPKRVSHHRHIEHLITRDEMVAKVRVAVEQRRDPDFVIIARTGGVANEGFDAAVDRANAYLDAGADMAMIFPRSKQEWVEAPKRVRGPLATIASLDQRSAAAWTDLGFRLVIDAFTGQTAAIDAIRTAYREQRDQGHTTVGLAHHLEVYNDLPRLAGLEELYDIERATTEPGT